MEEDYLPPRNSKKVESKKPVSSRKLARKEKKRASDIEQNRLKENKELPIRDFLEESVDEEEVVVFPDSPPMNATEATLIHSLEVLNFLLTIPPNFFQKEQSEKLGKFAVEQFKTAADQWISSHK
jgi:hypothetical protein